MPLSVYYDGGCPMCSKEMALYQRLDAKYHSQQNSIGSPVVNFVDITKLQNLPPVLQKAGVESLDDLVKHLHVSLPDGTISKNAEAFCVLWSRLPYWKHFAKFCMLTPGVLPLAEYLYQIFATRRYIYRTKGLPDTAACRIPEKKKKAAI